jgi:hypothetical protein
MRSDLQALPTQEPQDKTKSAEPVVGLLMALATPDTTWWGYQSAATTRQSNRLMNYADKILTWHRVRGLNRLV